MGGPNFACVNYNFIENTLRRPSVMRTRAEAGWAEGGGAIFAKHLRVCVYLIFHRRLSIGTVRSRDKSVRRRTAICGQERTRDDAFT